MTTQSPAVTYRPPVQRSPGEVSDARAKLDNARLAHDRAQKALAAVVRPGTYFPPGEVARCKEEAKRCYDDLQGAQRALGVLLDPSSATTPIARDTNPIAPGAPSPIAPGAPPSTLPYSQASQAAPQDPPVEVYDANGARVDGGGAPYRAPPTPTPPSTPEPPAEPWGAKAERLLEKFGKLAEDAQTPEGKAKIVALTQNASHVWNGLQAIKSILGE